jgi:predicted HicB family RNase H-like nuclease
MNEFSSNLKQLTLLFCFTLSVSGFAKCPVGEVLKVDSKGRPTCMDIEKLLSHNAKECKEKGVAHACLELKNHFKGTKTEEVFDQIYVEILTKKCTKDKLASFCGKMAGHIDQKHYKKEFLKLSTKEVKLKKQYWSLACKYSGKNQKSNFFCFQKDFLKRIKKDLALKCQHKIDSSCSKLETFKSKYKI